MNKMFCGFINLPFRKSLKSYFVYFVEIYKNIHFTKAALAQRSLRINENMNTKFIKVYWNY